MNILFAIIPFFVFAMFFLVFGLIIFALIRGAGQWNKNNKSPRLTVDVKVVAKRTQFSRGGGQHHHVNTRYFVTFEVESGDRFELPLEGRQYGLMVEGDSGKLTFQGTRFLDFERGRPA